MKLNHINLTVFIALLNFFLIICFAPEIFSPSFFHDGGGGSFLNIVLILLTLILVVRNIFNTTSNKERFAWICLVYVVEIYLFREADFHRAFTVDHITKALFYTNAEIPLLQRFIGGLVMLGFILSFLYLIINYIQRIFRAFFEREAWAIALFLWGGLLVISQLADKSFLNGYRDWRVAGIEEMLEIAAAAYLVSSISLFTFAKFQDK